MTNSKPLSAANNQPAPRLNNPFRLLRKPLYQGQTHILVGVALGLDKPATAAVVDGTTGTIARS